MSHVTAFAFVIALLMITAIHVALLMLIIVAISISIIITTIPIVTLVSSSTTHVQHSPCPHASIAIDITSSCSRPTQPS